MPVRLRLIPSDTAVFGDLALLGDTLVEGANALAELVGTDPRERETIRAALIACDRRGEQLTSDVMRRLNGSFIPPFDREDVYALAGALDECLGSLSAAGDLVVVLGLGSLPAGAVDLVTILVRQGELTAQAMRRLGRLKDLAGYWVEIHRLEKEAARSYRQLLAQLYDDPGDVRTLLKTREVLEQLKAGMASYNAVARVVETIAVKEI